MKSTERSARKAELQRRDRDGAWLRPRGRASHDGRERHYLPAAAVETIGHLFHESLAEGVAEIVRDAE